MSGLIHKSRLQIMAKLLSWRASTHTDEYLQQVCPADNTFGVKKINTSAPVFPNFDHCPKCLWLDHSYSTYRRSGKSYRPMENYSPTVTSDISDIFRSELEHWRLRNEKLIIDLCIYRLLDDRLIEQLINKLLEVLPFEIVYLIMYSY